MTHVGIDLGQFVSDPYTSGIQRVIQHLAHEWPVADIPCDFVVPWNDEFLLCKPEQTADMLDAAFAASSGDDVRRTVAKAIEDLSRQCDRASLAELLSMYSSWLLPEVAYHPKVLERLALFNEVMPCTMIGYDALPMTDPANYRFTPGTTSLVSEYFRLLTQVDSVVCISDYSRAAILQRLRRHPSRRTVVAHPGGDHVAISVSPPPLDSQSAPGPVMFLRVGTMESRKQPLELLHAFQAARTRGVDASLVFVGAPSASDLSINDSITAAVRQDPAITWVQDASDADVARWQEQADVFLSFGIEGYGIPVLESLRRGSPVLFGGIQPAAEIMDGKGAHRIEEPDHDSLTRMFDQYAQRRVAEDLRHQIQPREVPSWREFTLSVARASVG